MNALQKLASAIGTIVDRPRWIPTLPACLPAILERVQSAGL